MAHDPVPHLGALPCRDALATGSSWNEATLAAATDPSRREIITARVRQAHEDAALVARELLASLASVSMA